MNLATENPDLLSNQANSAYQAGFHRRAVDMFRRAAELALEQNKLTSHVHNLRWTGNSLMWAERHDEAFTYLLRAVSHDGTPEAAVEDLFGAMTDLCLLSARSRSYGLLRRTLADARAFAARRGRERWDHRLDLTEAFGHLRRGEFNDAHQLAWRAWQRMQLTPDGPFYQTGAYLNHLFRAAHGLGDVAAMDTALDLLLRRAEKHLPACQIRKSLCQAIRLAFNGLSEANGESIEHLVREAMGIMTACEWVRDESMEALRLLAMLGRWDEAAERLRAAGFAERADTALLRLDFTICKLMARTDWRALFYTRFLVESNPPQPLLTENDPDRSQALSQLREAEETARAEDARMECDFYSKGVALRRRWLLGETGNTAAHGGAWGP